MPVHKSRPRVSAMKNPQRHSILETLERRTMYTVTPDPGSTLATAFNVGDLNGQVTLGDAVGSSDASDVYEFSMPRAGQFVGRLRVDSGSADITLIRQTFDSNGHEIDPVIISRTATRDGADMGFASGDLPGQSLIAGNYFLFITTRSGDSPYLVRMTADYAGDTLATSRNVGSATDASFQDFVGSDTSPSLHDPVDLYKFKMDAPGVLFADMELRNAGPDLSQSHLALIRDANGNGAIDPGELLARTDPGNIRKLILPLPAGTYFLQVANDLTFSNYDLRINADYAGATATTARTMGSLDSIKSFNDFISTTEDPTDNYLFTVTASRPLFLSLLESEGGGSRLSLYKDNNNDGIPQDSELLAFHNATPFARDLETIGAGHYIVQVQAISGSGTYSLAAEARPDLAGNTLKTAKNLGAVNGLKHLDDYVSDDDPVDFYKFTTAASGTIGASIFCDFADANLSLIRDANNNGIVDKGDALATATILPMSQSKEFTTKISAGTYFLRVTFNDLDGFPSKYFVSFQTDYAGSTPKSARNVGSLSGTKTFDDWASGPFSGAISDTADVYKFSLSSTRTFSAKMIGVIDGQDLDLQLYRDKNNDGVLSSSELITSSHKVNSPNESLSKSLAAGTYFVKVVGLNGETNYHLSLKA